MTAPNRPSAPPERLAPPTRPAIIVAAAEHPGLKTYLSVIWHRRRLVIALPIVFGILAGVFSILRPRQYDARAAFVATEPQSMSSSLSALSTLSQREAVYPDTEWDEPPKHEKLMQQS